MGGDDVGALLENAVDCGKAGLFVDGFHPYRAERRGTAKLTESPSSGKPAGGANSTLRGPGNPPRVRVSLRRRKLAADFASEAV